MKSVKLNMQTPFTPKPKIEPFQRAKLQMGEFAFHYNTESSDLWKGRATSWMPPIGMRDYDSMSMKAVQVTKSKREATCSERYSRVIDNNPNVFRKKSGDFTKYIDSTIRVARVGPFSKKNNK